MCFCQNIYGQLLLLLLLVGGSETMRSNNEYCGSVPPDLTIPSASIQLPSWLADGSPSLQGWDTYQKMLVDGALSGDFWIKRLTTEILPGLATVIMEPPHTAFKYGGGGGAGGSNDTAFRAAVEAFRRQGVKVVLYSSDVHKGEDREWANGSLATLGRRPRYPKDPG